MARWLALIAMIQQLSCAGGGAGGSAVNGNLDPAPAAGVAISPPSAQISAGASLTFTVTVQNAANPAVTWRVNGISGGNSVVGAITPAGAATASYTAPASVSAPLTVTVSAVLQADATKSASATVTVNPLPGPRITVSPANATVVQGTSLQFSAIVQNAPQAVIWEVNHIPGGVSTFGTISSSGFYTAPALIPNPAAVTITALLFSNSSVSGSTTLTVLAPIPTVSISPSTANVGVAGTLQFSATVQNSSAPVTWQVSGPPGNSGVISSTGAYTAAFSAPTSPTIPTPFSVTITATLPTVPPITASSGVTIISTNTLAGVYSWKNDNSLTGQNGQETTLTPSSLSGATGKTFGKSFGCPVDGAIFAQPLYVANVAIGNATHNVVYVATENDTVYAFDADNGACQVLWQVSFTNSALGITAVPAADIPGQTDILPLIGITGTPVIDPNTATLYVVSKTKINQGATPSYRQELHALDLASGSEKFGGPVIIHATVAGTGGGSVSGTISFDSLTENQRSALLLAGGNIYVAFDSYAGAEPFHGWLLAYNAADLQSPPAVFISTPDGTLSDGGIGQSGAAPSADTSGNTFVVTSDGDTFNPNTGDYPETLLKLQMNSNPPVADYFTPYDLTILNLPQKHFGSTGVLLLPGSAPSPVPLAIAGNELGNLYVLNRNNLGGFNGPKGPDNIVQTLTLAGSIFGTPAYWAGNNTVYVAAAGDNLRALTLANGMLSSPSCSPPSLCSTDTFPLFGASPVISWDGSDPATGIVWALDTSGYLTSPPQPAVLRAYDATTLQTLVTPSVGSTAPGLAVKFAVPAVANGKVFVGTQTELSVFGLQ